MIVDEYARKADRIRVVNRNHGNIGSGRNAALRMATGDYITFVDDDDSCKPDLLEFLYTLAVECNSDVSICGEIKEEDVSRIVLLGSWNISLMYKVLEMPERLYHMV